MTWHVSCLLIFCMFCRTFIRCCTLGLLAFTFVFGPRCRWYCRFLVLSLLRQQSARPLRGDRNCTIRWSRRGPCRSVSITDGECRLRRLAAVGAPGRPYHGPFAIVWPGGAVRRPCYVQLVTDSA